MRRLNLLDLIADIVVVGADHDSDEDSAEEEEKDAELINKQFNQLNLKHANNEFSTEEFSCLFDEPGTLLDATMEFVSHKPLARTKFAGHSFSEWFELTGQLPDQHWLTISHLGKSSDGVWYVRATYEVIELRQVANIETFLASNCTHINRSLPFYDWFAALSYAPTFRKFEVFGMKVKKLRSSILEYKRSLKTFGNLAPFCFKLMLAEWHPYPFYNTLDNLKFAHGYAHRFGFAQFVILNLFSQVALPTIHQESRPVWRFHHNFGMTITIVVKGCLRIKMQRVVVKVPKGHILFMATGVFFEVCTYPKISITTLH